MADSESYDVFVIDEADDSILNKGSAVDTAKKCVLGFWDLLSKRTILLTATMGQPMEDLLFELFGVKRETYLTFEEMISKKGPNTCKASIEYCIVKSDKEYWDRLKAEIHSRYLTQPLIVFVDTKKKISQLKRLCQDLHLQFNSAVNDP